MHGLLFNRLVITLVPQFYHLVNFFKAWCGANPKFERGTIDDNTGYFALPDKNNTLASASRQCREIDAVVIEPHVVGKWEDIQKVVGIKFPNENGTLVNFATPIGLKR